MCLSTISFNCIKTNIAKTETENNEPSEYETCCCFWLPIIQNKWAFVFLLTVLYATDLSVTAFSFGDLSTNVPLNIDILTTISSTTLPSTTFYPPAHLTSY